LMRPACTALILLTGISCATFGNRINPAHVNQLKEGLSTQEDAIKLLGPPTTTAESGETTTLVWMYAHEGPLGDRETTIIQLIFDANGRLNKKAIFGTSAKY
jgi:outer membrane protein assembly factor BamE (lipoprotein component of BamABCDE complex)